MNLRLRHLDTIARRALVLGAFLACVQLTAGCQSTRAPATTTTAAAPVLPPDVLFLADMSGVTPLLEKSERAPTLLLSHLRTQVKRLRPEAMPSTEDLAFAFATGDEAASVFRAKVMMPAAFSRLGALSARTRTQSLAYFDSAPRKALDAALHDLGTNLGQRRLMHFIRMLRDHPPVPERITLLDALVTSSGEIERRLGASFDASQAFLNVLAPALPKGLRPEPAQSRIERKQFAARSHRTLVIELDSITRELSVDDLAALVRFWQTRAGLELRDATVNAVKAGVAEAASAAAAVVEDRLTGRPAPELDRDRAAGAETQKDPEPVEPTDGPTSAVRPSTPG